MGRKRRRRETRKNARANRSGQHTKMHVSVYVIHNYRCIRILGLLVIFARLPSTCAVGHNVHVIKLYCVFMRIYGTMMHSRKIPANNKNVQRADCVYLVSAYDSFACIARLMVPFFYKKTALLNSYTAAYDRLIGCNKITKYLNAGE